MAPKLRIADLSDLFHPGDFFLTNVHSANTQSADDLGTYWPALILDKCHAPLKVERALRAPIATEDSNTYLIWLIGKGRFFFGYHGHIYEPHQSQLQAFGSSESDQSFKSILEIGLRHNAAQMLDRFKNTIMADKLRSNGAEPVLPPEAGSARGSRPKGTKRPCDNPAVGRNVRARGDSTSIGSSSSIASVPCATIIQSARANAPIVKQEPDEDIHLRPGKKNVRVFVGKHNTEFTCNYADIAKSPVLSTFIIDRGDDQPPFIMHPDLKDIDPIDFACLLDFLHNGTWKSALAEGVDPARFVVLLEDLDGNADAGLPLLEDVRQCGRLHVMARTFQVPEMVDQIAIRIKNVCRGSALVLHDIELLQLAGTVFGAAMQTAPIQKTYQVVKEKGKEDEFETWLITRMVERLELITTGHNTGALFWDVMRAGEGVNLSGRVWERRTEFEEKKSPAEAPKLEN